MYNSHDVIAAVLGGTRPPRTPLFDLLANDAVIEHFAGRGLDGTDDGSVVFQAVGCALDATRCVGPPRRKGETWLDEVGNTRVAHRWTQWVQKPAFSQLEPWTAWMDQYVRRAEAGDATLGRLALTEADAELPRRAAAAAGQRRFNEALGGTVYIHCTPSTTLNALVYYLGLDTLSYLWTDHRELVARWLDLYRRETLHYIDVTAHPAHGPLAMIYSDIAYNHGPMFSRKMLVEMGFFAEVAALCDACHRRGLKVIFHSDGDLRPLLPDLTATGIDGLNPLEAAAGMDVFEIHRCYPGLILAGGVDATHLLRAGTVAEIRRQTRRMIDEIGAEGRLLIGSSTEVGDDIPLDNYLAFHDEAMR
jgi:hypothetical protein